MNSVQERFLKAFELVKNPDSWIGNGLIKADEKGRFVSSYDEAKRFCSLGALVKNGLAPIGESEHHVVLGFREYCDVAISNMNDCNPHSVVVQKWQDFINQHDWSQYDEQ